MEFHRDGAYEWSHLAAGQLSLLSEMLRQLSQVDLALLPKERAAAVRGQAAAIRQQILAMSCDEFNDAECERRRQAMIDATLAFENGGSQRYLLAAYFMGGQLASLIQSHADHRIVCGTRVA